jgi:hypothetical protein
MQIDSLNIESGFGQGVLDRGTIYDNSISRFGAPSVCFSLHSEYILKDFLVGKVSKDFYLIDRGWAVARALLGL